MGFILFELFEIHSNHTVIHGAANTVQQNKLELSVLIFQLNIVNNYRIALSLFLIKCFIKYAKIEKWYTVNGVITKVSSFCSYYNKMCVSMQKDF